MHFKIKYSYIKKDLQHKRRKLKKNKKFVSVHVKSIKKNMDNKISYK